MLPKDLKPNRMEALKSRSDFADERPNDRIGLVVYASEAYTKHRLPDKEWCWRPLKA
jgi:Ca-activated chloride channel family protein